MAILVPHEESSNIASASPLVYSSLPSTTTGNALIVLVMPVDTFDVTVLSMSISPGSGTFNLVKAQAGGAGTWGGVECWWCSSLTGGTTPSLTINWTGGVGSGSVVGVIEASGLGTTTDGSAAAGPTSSNAAASTNITTTNANDLIVGGVNIAQTFVSGDAAYTKDSTTGNLVQYQIVSSATSYGTNATLSGSGYWSSLVAAFKAAAAGADPSVAVNPKIYFP